MENQINQKARWINIKGKVIDKEILISLHTSYMDRSTKMFELVFKILSYYTTLLTGILVAEISIYSILPPKNIRLLILVISVLSVFLSFSGWRQCSRIFQKYLIDIAQVNKLESLLGLYSQVKESDLCEKFPFPKDNKLGVHENFYKMLNTYSSTEKFCMYKSKVRNRVNSVFICFIAISITIIIIILIAHFY